LRKVCKLKGQEKEMFRKTAKLAGILFLLLIIGIGIWGYAPDIPAAELKKKYANVESEFIKLDNGQIVHVRDEGPKEAPAIILLHGSSSSLHTWDAWTKVLSAEYRIIRFDQIGHGLTGPEIKDCYTAACFVNTVGSIAKQKGLSKFTLGGNSMGGWVAWEYAKAHPDKLDGLILVDAAGAPDAKPKSLPIGFRMMQMPVINRLAAIITPRSLVEKSLRQSVSKPDYITEKEIDLYWELLRYPGNRDATLKRNAARRQPQIAQDISPRLPIPTLILWGDEDKLIPVTAAKWFHKQLPNNKTIIYSRTGHLPMQEVAEQSASDVQNWMDNKGAGG
jgi:pimeloyl-ACP methyl ester carboxylesterase